PCSPGDWSWGWGRALLILLIVMLIFRHGFTFNFVNRATDVFTSLIDKVADHPFGGEKRRDVMTKSFTVDPGGSLRMNVDRGSIQIETADTNIVEITVEREMSASDEHTFQKTLEDHHITMSEHDNEVKIESEAVGSNRGHWSIWSSDL